MMKIRKRKQRVAIIVLISTAIFIYGMLIVSEKNTCTGVREYNCVK